MGIWEETGGGRASVSNPLAAGPGGDPEDGRGGARAAAAAPRVLQGGALELERRQGRGASDAKNLLEHNSSERDPLDNWSVYRLYVFSSVDQAPNVMREWIYLFYCLGCLVVQMLVPAALFVNQYRSDDPDPEKRYEYKRFCPSDGKLSAKLLVFLIALMYFIKMSPLGPAVTDAIPADRPDAILAFSPDGAIAREPNTFAAPSRRRAERPVADADGRVDARGTCIAHIATVIVSSTLPARQLCQPPKAAPHATPPTTSKFG